MKLRLGLPKGSLQDATFALFQRAGYDVKVASRSYHPVIDDPEIEPVLLRPQEIPRYLEDGLIDAGLTGHDWISDCGADLHEISELCYSKLTSNPIRVVLAVHKDSPYEQAEDLKGKTVATEYMRLTQRFFAERGVDVRVEFSWGACEVKVPDLVEAIVVNTETGSSLRAHNLRIVETLLTSTTRFVANREAWADESKREKLENLAILLDGAMNASRLVGLKMNVPVDAQSQVHAILPSLQNPTISPLADPGWVAMEVILSEHDSRDLIPRLKRAGATGLVEYPLNKVVY
ncbi:MAG: ATP phosphoribosyltransferase [Armatimonadetes bacterium]|nr:ATP phosphoribosyltransferase [Armatimonadota bacterium]MBS1710707.1 ATP phosphoribosyltransferase [Armatimonadota bacterium]MBX3108378.1 ATP phosphoribosyltransferase [Fimbriimonadaceae bacterium]